MIMPPVQIPMNRASNFGFTAFRNIIREGRDKVVTAIIKDKIAPSCAPLANRASATGIVPKISIPFCQIRGFNIYTSRRFDILFNVFFHMQLFNDCAACNRDNQTDKNIDNSDNRRKADG